MEEVLYVILVAICLGFITAMIAAKRGRDFVGWWLFGSLLFIVALPLVLILEPKNAKRCPECAEPVKDEAMKCRFCGHMFEVSPSVTAANQTDVERSSGENKPFLPASPREKKEPAERAIFSRRSGRGLDTGSDLPEALSEKETDTQKLFSSSTARSQGAVDQEREKRKGRFLVGFISGCGLAAVVFVAIVGYHTGIRGREPKDLLSTETPAKEQAPGSPGSRTRPGTGTAVVEQGPALRMREPAKAGRLVPAAMEREPKPARAPNLPSLEITAPEPPPLSQLSQPSEPPRIVKEKVIVGPYKVLYSTSVHREPREDSVRVANIEPGTKVHVVDVQGEWLEIRSKHGRPPGFIKKDSAIPTGSSEGVSVPGPTP